MDFIMANSFLWVTHIDDMILMRRNFNFYLSFALIKFEKSYHLLVLFPWCIVWVHLKSYIDKFYLLDCFDFAKVLWYLWIINELLTIEGPWQLQPEVWNPCVCFAHDKWDNKIISTLILISSFLLSCGFIRFILSRKSMLLMMPLLFCPGFWKRQPRTA